MNIVREIFDKAAKGLAKPCLFNGEKCLSYEEVKQHCEDVNAAFKKLFRDRKLIVGITMQSNSIPYAIALLAALSDSVVAPLNASLSQDEFEVAIVDFGINCLVVDEAVYSEQGSCIAAALKYNIPIGILNDDFSLTWKKISDSEWEEVTSIPDGTALLLQTSGTTSKPKSTCEFYFV